MQLLVVASAQTTNAMQFPPRPVGCGLGPVCNCICSNQSLAESGSIEMLFIVKLAHKTAQHIVWTYRFVISIPHSQDRERVPVLPNASKPAFIFVANPHNLVEPDPPLENAQANGLHPSSHSKGTMNGLVVSPAEHGHSAHGHSTSSSCSSSGHDHDHTDRIETTTPVRPVPPCVPCRPAGAGGHSPSPHGAMVFGTSCAHGPSKQPMMTPQQLQVKSTTLRKFRAATMLCTIFLVVEIIGGYISGSLAIYSDAAHLVSDLASIGVAMGAAYLADLPQTQYYTYGLKRVESLAALLSMVSLAAISLYLFAAALVRLLWQPEPVNGQVMSLVAGIGVLVNCALAAVLGEHHVHMPGDDHGHDHGHDHHHGAGSPCAGHAHQEDKKQHPKKTSGCSGGGHDHSHDHHDHSHGHHHDNDDCEKAHDHRAPNDDVPANETTSLLPTTQNGSSINNNTNDAPCAPSSWEITDYIPFLPDNINLRATYLHVLGDLCQSVAVFIAGLLLWAFPEQTWIDAVATLLFCAIVFFSTIATVKSSLAVLLQQVPGGIQYQDLLQRLNDVPNIYNVHDLHIWSIAHGIPSLSVHCHTTDETPQQTLTDIYHICCDAGIYHVTAQVQTALGGTSCVTCQNSVCRIEPC
jgi:solute carrier family 30 (zinc transporter), member 2